MSDSSIVRRKKSLSVIKRRNGHRTSNRKKQRNEPMTFRAVTYQKRPKFTGFGKGSGSYAPAGALPVVRNDDAAFPLEYYYPLAPGLYDIGQWLIPFNKDLNFKLYNHDPTSQVLVDLYANTVIGDGLSAVIYKENYKQNVSAEIDEDKTDRVNQWFKHIGGKGNSINNYVIRQMIIDNILSGVSVFYKYQQPDDADPEVAGKLTLKHLDARSYIVDYHPLLDYEKVIQYRRHYVYSMYRLHRGPTPIGYDRADGSGMQIDPTRMYSKYPLPRNHEEFDDWLMVYTQTPYNNLIHTTGYADRFVCIKSKDYYKFNLFPNVPYASVVNIVIEKLRSLYFMGRGNSKYALPTIMIGVPRYMGVEEHQQYFEDVLQEATESFAEIENSQVVGYESESFNPMGQQIGPGWKIVPLPIDFKDFVPELRYFNEEIGNGIGIPYDLISSISATGTIQRSSGSFQQAQRFGSKVLSGRETIIANILPAIRAFFDFEDSIKLPYNRIELRFGPINMSDPAIKGQLALGIFDRGGLNTNELRQVGSDLLRMDLKPQEISPYENLKHDRELHDVYSDLNLQEFSDVSARARAANSLKIQNIEDMLQEIYKFVRDPGNARALGPSVEPSADDIPRAKGVEIENGEELADEMVDQVGFDLTPEQANVITANILTHSNLESFSIHESPETIKLLKESIGKVYKLFNVDENIYIKSHKYLNENPPKSDGYDGYMLFELSKYIIDNPILKEQEVYARSDLESLRIEFFSWIDAAEHVAGNVGKIKSSVLLEYVIDLSGSNQMVFKIDASKIERLLNGEIHGLCFVVDESGRLIVKCLTSDTIIKELMIHDLLEFSESSDGNPIRYQFKFPSEDKVKISVPRVAELPGYNLAELIAIVKHLIRSVVTDEQVENFIQDKILMESMIE